MDSGCVTMPGARLSAAAAAGVHLVRARTGLQRGKMRGWSCVGPCSWKSYTGTGWLLGGSWLGCNVALQGQMQEVELLLYGIFC